MTGGKKIGIVAFGPARLLANTAAGMDSFGGRLQKDGDYSHVQVRSICATTLRKVLND